jgi:hypothetical protein
LSGIDRDATRRRVLGQAGRALGERFHSVGRITQPEGP